MLPTLKGRWLTRILLFFWIGLPVTLVYSLYIATPESPVLPLIGWNYGLLLDPVYIHFQQYRWERDWPFAFQFFFSIVEFLIVLALVWRGALDFTRSPLDLHTPENYLLFAVHFACVFIPSFLALLGFIQIFMIRWRFKGGEWGRM